MTTQKQNELARTVTFSFLTIFTIAILFSFIRYSIVDDVSTLTDVGLEWIGGYLTLLAWYATKIRILRKSEDNGIRSLPGQYFVYVTWTAFIVLLFLYHNGWSYNSWSVQRVPSNFHIFFLGVTGIYAGSRIVKLLTKTK